MTQKERDQMYKQVDFLQSQGLRPQGAKSRVDHSAELQAPGPEGNLWLGILCGSAISIALVVLGAVAWEHLSREAAGYLGFFVLCAGHVIWRERT